VDVFIAPCLLVSSQVISPSIVPLIIRPAYTASKANCSALMKPCPSLSQQSSIVPLQYDLLTLKGTFQLLNIEHMGRRAGYLV